MTFEHWIRDGRNDRQRTHCKRGHPYDEKNTYWYKDPKGYLIRVCRACNKLHNTMRQRLYGVSRERYEQMVAEQNGVCAICGGPPGERSLNVDHDHATGQVRSLLCTRCNIGIGGFRDDPTLILKALAYLERWKTPPKS